MLYPLSYEGLRPTCYPPGDTRECPGVPGRPIREQGLASVLVSTPGAAQRSA